MQEVGNDLLHLGNKYRHLAHMLLILDCLKYKKFVGGECFLN